jgi:hypothetical protein
VTAQEEEGVMPKEQISFRQIDTVTDPATGRDVHTERDEITATVGWNRAGWVQVSLGLSQDRLRSIAGSYADEPEVFIYSDVLGRSEINRMIQTLRKARDQAYGKDA